MDFREEQASKAPEFDRKSQHAPELIENRPEAAPQVWQMPPLPEQQQQRFGPFGDSQASFSQVYAAHHGVHTPPPPPPPPLKAEGDIFLHDSAEKHRRRPGRIAGLPVWAFWLLLGVAGLAVIGASVGGAIGGTSAAKDHSASSTGSASSSGSGTAGAPSAASSASSSSASTTTSGTPTTSAAISSTSSTAMQSASLLVSGNEIYTQATSDCPGSNGTSYTPGTAGGGGASPYTYTKYCGANMDFGFNDITEAYVLTFDNCIDMCSSWNYYNTGGVQCAGVVFQYGDGGQPPGNCWIKNTTGTPTFMPGRQTDVALPVNVDL